VKFIDEVEVMVSSGDGGPGAVSFRREAHVPFGGPNGGDGGRGADVILEADPQLGTLLEFRYKPRWSAPKGESGRGSDCNGKRGEDLLLKVPVGTVVYDAETGELVADLSETGTRVVVAEGGRGGLGNMNFATPWDQAPRHAQPGEPGESRKLRLELKLLADVGILGFPNAGKSTFIAAVSRAKPKIANYPFTTLIPNLGVARVDEFRSFLMADIPGLIPGAASGAGLGIRFLKHVERTRVFLHLITPEGDDFDLLARYDALLHEVASFDPDLARRPQVVAASQIDLPDARAAWELARPAFEARGITLYGVSAVTGEGVREIVYKLESLLQTAPQVAPRATALPRELGRRPREEAPDDDEDAGELEVLRG
jgi:GTP-binding protein